MTGQPICEREIKMTLFNWPLATFFTWMSVSSNTPRVLPFWRTFEMAVGTENMLIMSITFSFIDMEMVCKWVCVRVMGVLCALSLVALCCSGAIIRAPGFPTQKVKIWHPKASAMGVIVLCIIVRLCVVQRTSPLYYVNITGYHITSISHSLYEYASEPTKKSNFHLSSSINSHHHIYVCTSHQQFRLIAFVWTLFTLALFSFFLSVSFLHTWN